MILRAIREGIAKGLGDTLSFVARLAIRYRIPYAMLRQLLLEGYLKAAREDAQVVSERVAGPNEDLMHIFTGMRPEEMESALKGDRSTDSLGVLAEAVELWHTPEFLDKYDQPMTLDEESLERFCDALGERTGRRMATWRVADQLARFGIGVWLTAEDEIRDQDDYGGGGFGFRSPTGMLYDRNRLKQLEGACESVSALLSIALHNIREPGQSSGPRLTHFQRVSNHISQESRPQCLQELAHAALEYEERVRRILHFHQAEGGTPVDVGAGTYVFIRPSTLDDAPVEEP